MRWAVIERLMCDLEVDFAAVTRAYGRDANGDLADEIETLRGFEDDGLLLIDGRRLRITSKGRPFVRLVAAKFDAYLRQGKARHSLAV